MFKQTRRGVFRVIVLQHICFISLLFQRYSAQLYRRQKNQKNLQEGNVFTHSIKVDFLFFM